MEGHRDAASSLSARWSLQGYTALVTGGSRGIGRAIVEELAGLGACVYTCARTGAHLEECLKQCKEAGLKVEGSVCDVTSREARIKLIQDVSLHFGNSLDILVNNVGTLEPKPALFVSPQEYAFQMSTNVESAYHLSQLSHPLLKASSRGRIVFISSIAGHLIPASCSVYSMTKAAINQLTKCLASEWVKDGILVNAVAPGVIKSDLSSSLAVEESRFLKDIPVGRLGEAKEAAAAVAFLCMPCASFCTGHVLVVDGGTSIRPIFA